MFIFLSVMNILLVLGLAVIAAVVLNQHRSKAQLSFVLFDVFVAVFVLGLELELLYSESAEAALSGLTVQYFGQCGFLIALLLFANEFIDMKVPKWVFIIQAGMSLLVLFGILTAARNQLFYTSMTIVKDGLYPRMRCTYGPLWYMYYAYFICVFLYIILFCFRKYQSSNVIHKRRIIYLITGLTIFIIELLLKGCGVFGSYNPVSIALTGTVVCLGMGVLKEGYFDSIDATIENVLNHGDEGLIVLDTWSRIIFANEQAVNLFPDLKIGYSLAVQKSLKKAMDQNEEYLHIKNDVWEARMEDIIENSIKTGVMIYFINVTELVKQSEELKAMNDERVRFMTRVSHELRSPLNVALGADEMILKETRDASVREYAEMIREDIGSMTGLVEDIINTSLAEQNMLSLHKESFSLNALLSHVRSVYQGKAREKKLHFSLRWDGMNIENHEIVQLKGDRKRLLQILINLLDNAVKYTEKGEFSLNVTDHDAQENTVRIVFQVSDTGKGIPYKEQKKIFEKYKRGEEAVKSGKEGLGLGLSIVRSFLEAMGGSIELHSEPGRGSIFTVEIPFEKETVPVSLQEEAAFSSACTGKKVLICDDRDRNIMILRHQLKDSGLIIDEAHDGSTAVKMCSKKQYDALIIDYMMPGMDGVETLQAIRGDNEGKNRSIYAVVFSANVTPEAEKMYYEAGFSDFLAKPVYYRDLVKTMNRAFEEDTEEKDENVVNHLKKLGVNTDQGIEYSDGDKKFYYELLYSFVNSYALEKAELLSVYQHVSKRKRTLESGLDSWKEFTRIVHGIKGELRSFGDQSGADLFYSLEKDGKAENLEDIKNVLPEALDHLDAFVAAVIESED